MPYSCPIPESLAAAATLLVASDFDGTLAPLVARPEDACARPGSVAALLQLGALPRTRVAIVTGRSLEDVRRRLEVADGWELCGSHGAEIAGVPAPPIPPQAAAELAQVTQLLESIAAEHPGVIVEQKARGVALHYRALPQDRSRQVVARARALLDAAPSLHCRLGSKVIEFVADAATKADALGRLKKRTGSASTVFIGDDLTDEHAFAALGPDDAGVKVGAGETIARYRVADVAEVERLLHHLAHLRAEWVQRLADHSEGEFNS